MNSTYWQVWRLIHYFTLCRYDSYADCIPQDWSWNTFVDSFKISLEEHSSAVDMAITLCCCGNTSLFLCILIIFIVLRIIGYWVGRLVSRSWFLEWPKLSPVLLGPLENVNYRRMSGNECRNRKVSPLVVTDNVGRLKLSLEWASPWNVILGTFSFSALPLLFEEEEGYTACKKLDVDGDDLTGALHML